MIERKSVKQINQEHIMTSHYIKKFSQIKPKIKQAFLKRMPNKTKADFDQYFSFLLTNFKVKPESKYLRSNKTKDGRSSVLVHFNSWCYHQILWESHNFKDNSFNSIKSK